MEGLKERKWNTRKGQSGRKGDEERWKRTIKLEYNMKKKKIMELKRITFAVKKRRDGAQEGRVRLKGDSMEEKLTQNAGKGREVWKLIWEKMKMELKRTVLGGAERDVIGHRRRSVDGKGQHGGKVTKAVI